MRARGYSPLTSCFTGFTWLTLGSILGLAILIGLVRGTPLPSWVRSLHVHATLIGGVAQILLGGLLLLVAPPESKANLGSDSRPFTFWALNGGVIGMLVGFWLHHDLVVGIAGFAVIAGFLSIIRGIWTRARPVWNSSACRGTVRVCPVNYPAASSNEWRSHGLWYWNHRCFCLMNHCPISMPSCAAGCARKSVKSRSV